MNYDQIMMAAFDDELEKIAGELQGFTRIGRKPIGVERLLEREAESETTPTDVAEKATEIEAEKTSEMGNSALKALGLVGLGAAGAHYLRKANDDRRLGRQIRLQNQQ
jgi:hypothetical protein